MVSDFLRVAVERSRSGCEGEWSSDCLLLELSCAEISEVECILDPLYQISQSSVASSAPCGGGTRCHAAARPSASQIEFPSRRCPSGCPQGDRYSNDWHTGFSRTLPNDLSLRR